jgi:hypothetical protein
MRNCGGKKREKGEKEERSGKEVFGCVCDV